MENTLAGVAGKKFILSYSCGKDSTLCLHKKCWRREQSLWRCW